MQADKQQITRLLNTAKGQIEGILRMVEEDRYCIDISHQLMAAQSVLNRANKEVLRAHIQGCLIEAAQQGQVEEKSAEIIALLDKLIK